jgi:hypothetical protein
MKKVNLGQQTVEEAEGYNKECVNISMMEVEKSLPRDNENHL